MLDRGKLDFNGFLYGGDYNPDQWLDQPEVLEEDIRLMKQAQINAVTLGIFSWARLEPADGVYAFDWLEEIIDRLYENGIRTIMSTPSAAMPRWLARSHPEVLRTDIYRRPLLFEGRQIHCFTSPVYRDRVRRINKALAERFDHKDAVMLWHISNEYAGECHCSRCQDAFRTWLKVRYKDINALNRAWNAAFWGQDYQSFDDVESPVKAGKCTLNGLVLDWKRYVTHQTADFMKAEIAALRDGGARKPATTNFMYFYDGINYDVLARAVDIISWDNYPDWHKGKTVQTALSTGMFHDMARSYKRQPYLIMESSPGPTNWQSVGRLLPPGLLAASGLQGIAHGSESILYFQIRQSRGGLEKFHSAVIPHNGGGQSRMYQECARIGQSLKDLGFLSATVPSPASVAVIYDTENKWALDLTDGLRNKGLNYQKHAERFYTAFRRLGLNTDVIDMTHDLAPYKVVAAPLAYMLRPGFADRVREFVSNGGTFLTTYLSGIVDENDLCYTQGSPGPLKDVLGIECLETDILDDAITNRIRKSAPGTGKP